MIFLRLIVLSLVVALSGCAQLSALNPTNRAQCTAKNLTSRKVFTAYAPNQGQALKRAKAACVSGSEYGWRCENVSCSAHSWSLN